MQKKAVALLLACHPGPSCVVTVIVIVIGVALGYEPWRLVLLASAVATGQLSIGWSNDWIDAARDTAVHRGDKPIARGVIAASTVRTAAFAALTASIVLSVLLGPAAAAAQLAGVGAGWAYNAVLKRTVFSAVPYLVCFGLLPAVATFGQTQPAAPAAWVVVVGALLGVAAHLTNVLPDLEDDERTGIRGLPHVLGARVSGVAAFACLAVAGILLVLGPGLPFSGVRWIGLAATLVIAATGITLTVRRRTSRLLMRLVMTGAVVDVIMLAFTGHALLA